MAYSTLFYLEYAGPFFLWIIFSYCNLNKFNGYYFWVSLMMLFHFGKRLYETKYVHIFSNASAPLMGTMKNFFVYWIIVGLMAPIELFYLRKMQLGPCLFPCRFTETLYLIGFFVSEYFNYFCHAYLRSLREKVINGKKVIIYTK